jgi:hypothetical protein
MRIRSPLQKELYGFYSMSHGNRQWQKHALTLAFSPKLRQRCEDDLNTGTFGARHVREGEAVRSAGWKLRTGYQHFGQARRRESIPCRERVSEDGDLMTRQLQGGHQFVNKSRFVVNHHHTRGHCLAFCQTCRAPRNCSICLPRGNRTSLEIIPFCRCGCMEPYVQSNIYTPSKRANRRCTTA